jgi:hypothetical protein
MEGTHGELRARLADRLRRDDADRFAFIDQRAARSAKGTTVSPPSMTALVVMPSVVPQS